MSDFIINNGYAVVLTEDGKQYVNQQLQLNLQSIDITSKALVNQAKEEIKKFISQQESVINNLEAATGKSLKELLSTRSTENLGVTMYDDSKENLVKSQEEYEERVENIKKSANKYYNVMHKTIADFSLILKTISSSKDLENSLQPLFEKLKNSVSELEKEEEIFLNNLEIQIKEGKLTVEELKKQYEKVWQAYSKHAPINISKSGNGNYQITTPRVPKKITNAIHGMLKSLEELSIQTPKDLDKFLKINKRYASGKGAAKIARQTYDKLRDAYAHYLGDSKSIYNQKKAREAIYNLLCDFITSQNESTTELQLFADTSRGDITRKQANAAELTISKHSQRELQKVLPDMTVESTHLGDTRSREVQVSIEVSKFKEPHMRKSGIDINKIQDVQKDEKLFKEFEAQSVYDKVDDYLSIIDKTEKNEYIIAFSDKLYQAYSDSKHGLENIGIVASDGANLLSSLDLLTSKGEYSFSKNITDQLLFTMLNMSSASIYHSTAEKYKVQMTEFIDKILTAYFTNLAFNTSNFASQLPSTTASRQILYVTQADNIIVPLSTSLKAILKQLDNEDNMRKIITVEIAPDIEHDAELLYNASLQRFPVNGNLDTNQAARWNYVAQQVAHSTHMKVTYNILALAQYYKI